MREVRTTGTSPPSPTRPDADLPAPSDAFAADVRGIERRLVSISEIYLMGRLTAVLSRRLGLDLTTGWGPVLAGAAGAALRLALPVAAALAFGQLGESPVLRWALVAGVLGSLDAVGIHRHRESNPAVQGFTALLWTITREEDVRHLHDFARRRYRFGASASFAAGVALFVLLACALTAPTSLTALPAGSVVLLAVLAYEVGEIAFFTVGFMSPFLLREARFDHELFWLDPMGSKPVRRVLHAWAGSVGFVGVGLTGYLLLAVVLVTPGSPLLLPVVAAFTIAGYVAMLIALVGLRRSISAIAMRVLDEGMETLQQRITAYRGRLDSLAPHESEELERLVSMYETVCSASTSPSASATLGHAARAMLVPTLTFLLAVSSEVYAERLLDQLLP